MRAAFIFLVCSMLGCDTQGGWSEAPDADHAVAYAAGDFAFLDADLSVPDDDNPKPGVCPTCNGSGKVGDGRIMVDCGTCGGTGRIEEEGQKPQVYSAPPVQVLVFTASYCDPCEIFLGKKGDQDAPLDKLQRAGWTVGDTGMIRVVDIEKDVGLAKTYGVDQVPLFVLLENGIETRRHPGPMDQWGLGTFVTGKNMRVLPPVMYPSSWTGGHWTWPGDLRQHMIRAHGMEAGKAKTTDAETLMNIHDSMHEGSASVRTNYEYCPT